MFQVHAALQLPLLKSDAAQYQSDIDALLSLMVAINRPFSKSECNSIKYHWPRHWIGTRISLGCAYEVFAPTCIKLLVWILAFSMFWL